MTNSPSYRGSNGDTGVGPDHGSPPGTPRWVKVFVIIAVILVLLFVILQFVSGGEHGPRRHLPSDIDFGNRTLYSNRYRRPHNVQRRPWQPNTTLQFYRQRRATAMTMTPGLRKFTLTVHLAFSVGWIGAVIAYLALVVAAMTSQDAQTLRVSWIAMELIGRFAIVPLALASLLTGIFISLGTPWGLFRHYWVLFSFMLTVLATVVLLDHMQTVNFFAGIAAEMNSADVGELRGALWGELLHAGVGLLVLLVIQVLNMYKPRGLTPYGWRKLQAERRKQPEQRTTTQRVESQAKKNELPAERLAAKLLNLFAKKDNHR